MGYVCPVCEDPQADAEHLANHLAFTAMLGNDDHEAWLDEHAPEWADANPAELAPRVAEHAEETDFPQVFEDTTEGGVGGHGGHDHDHARDHDHEHQGTGASGDRGRSTGGGLGGAPGGVTDVESALGGDDVDPEDVLAEARKLTARRRERASEGGDGEATADEEADIDSQVDDGESDANPEAAGEKADGETDDASE